jgi:DNA-binding response OmpR family regulator
MNMENTLSGLDLDTASSASRPRVLVIDDDLIYLDMIKIVLRKAGFDVASASDHVMALEKCRSVNPDVILLDLMMPDVDGWELYHLLRGITQAPIIMVTASANRDNAVRSLELGMAEYIAKPFYNPEMIARIQKVLRETDRSAVPSVKVFPEIDLCIDYMSRQVFIRGMEVHLQQREYDLLLALASEAPRSVPYEELTRRLWGEDNPKNRGHLKAVVFALRQKLEPNPAAPSLIVNYRGVGYQLVTKSGE